MNNIRRHFWNVRALKIGGAAILVVSLSAFVAISLALNLPHWPSQTAGYRTVFTLYEGFLRQLAEAVFYVSIGAAFFIVAVIWIKRLRLPKWWWRHEAEKPFVLLVFGSIWLTLAGLGAVFNLLEAYGYVRSYSSGNVRIIQGTVHVLNKQPFDGHAEPDIIEINGVRATIDAFGRVPAYRDTISHGGVLSEGTIARLFVHNGKVVRVDLPLSQNASRPADVAGEK